VKAIVASHRDLSSPVPWRRSLRASQARRAQRARRRRLALRGRAGVALAIALCSVAAGGAVAQQAAPPQAPGLSSPDAVRALQQSLGVSPDGVYGTRTRAAVRRFQRAHGLAVDGVAGPQTLAELGVPAAGGDVAASGDPAPAEASPTLQRIAQCESGGDPTAVSADGTYRGKYQFDRATWERLGGDGDPAGAPEADQDRLAARLLADRGTAPWPNCA
jgi:peptidoglycan hydrolase-like protein with peptidoglycan-binding domain